MNSTSLSIREKLFDFKSGSVDLTSFQEWVSNNQETFKNLVSQGVLLKLRRGDMETVMGCIASFDSACDKCSGINPAGRFTSRQEFSICASHVDNALASGVLKRVKMPIWVKPEALQFGADAYYECTTCSTTWLLVEPEREDNGLWRRLN